MSEAGEAKARSAAGEDFDVLIAGAGLVGLALAPALARLGLEVALTDRAPIVAPALSHGYTSWDNRVYAISPGSASLLHALGAWQALPCERIAAIESMRVTGDEGALLDFSAYELHERALAWIVEERALRAALVPLIHAAGVTTLAPRTFESLTWSAHGGKLQFDDGTQARAKLVVAADGIRSWVRDAAAIVATPKPYGQTAVVANFDCEHAHHGRAYQWFQRDGAVLAWLPLAGRRISIVWSAPDSLAERLLGLAPAELSRRVADAGSNALGSLQCLAPASSFPLAFLRLPATVAHRLVLVGDAAHGIHPLAGQGVNLGFGDVEALANVLRERGPVTDPGARILLERYARRRVEAVRSMQAVTDGLVNLFGPGVPWLKRARNWGMSAVDRLPFAKRLLAQSALR